MSDQINFRMPRVFVGGPWTKPDPLANVNATLKLRSDIQAAGTVHMVCSMCDTFLWGTVYPSNYEEQTMFCLHELASCDIAVFRRGESSGRDREIQICNDLGIPVFWEGELRGFWDLVKEYQNGEKTPKWAMQLQRV